MLNNLTLIKCHDRIQHVSATDPATMLQQATKTFQGSKLTAVLGPPKCGKTVVAALLYNAIINEFIPRNKNYRIEVESGLDFLQTTMLSLQNGEFPLKTPESEINKVEMVLRQEVGTGGSIEIKLRDVAGEVYQDFYIQELPPPELLRRTLERDKGDKPFGDMSFLIFCKMYVILIDCQNFSTWNKLSFENVKLLNTIKAWKTTIKEMDNGKIKTPIAIMLTKADMLDEKNREQSTESLVQKYMPEFYQQLNSLVRANKEFFKVHLDIKRGPDNLALLSETGNFMVETPLSYSREEYIKFISWVDNNMA